MIKVGDEFKFKKSGRISKIHKIFISKNRNITSWHEIDPRYTENNLMEVFEIPDWLLDLDTCYGEMRENVIILDHDNRWTVGSRIIPLTNTKKEWLKSIDLIRKEIEKKFSDDNEEINKSLYESGLFCEYKDMTPIEIINFLEKKQK